MSFQLRARTLGYALAGLYFGGGMAGTAGMLGAGAGGAGGIGSTGMGWPSRTIVTLLRTTSVRGLSLELRSMCVMLVTRSTLWVSHWPKMVYLPSSSCWGVSVMKNWVPLVLGPALAMARRPATSKVMLGETSLSK